MHFENLNFKLGEKGITIQSNQQLKAYIL